MVGKISHTCPTLYYVAFTEHVYTQQHVVTNNVIQNEISS